MAQEKPSGQWAGEAFEFLRLFARIGNRISGLLILEIGWAALLTLVAGLSKDDIEPVLRVPPLFDYPGSEVDLPTLFTIGAFLILLIWCFSSGLYLYLSLPLRYLVRVMTIFWLFVFVIAFRIIHSPLYLILKRIENAKIRRWEKSIGADPLKQLVDEHGQEAVTSLAKEHIKFSATYLPDRLTEWSMNKVVRLASVASIGLAPIYSYSFEEDQSAAKAPLQIFAAAINRIRIRLRSARATQHFQFIVLPAMPRIEHEPTARRLRRWLLLDVLLWGSYLSARPPRIWLNLQHQLNEQPTGKRQQSEARESHDPLNADPVDDVMMIVDQDDPLDAYIVLLLVLLKTLEARQLRPFSFAPKYVDTLYLSISDQEQVLANLIRDALFAIDKPLVRRGMNRTVREVLVEYASRWVAGKIDDLGHRPEVSDQLLEEVARVCVKLDPESAEHHYRLGAVRCILNDEQGALQSFRVGQEKDRSFRWHNMEWISAMAGVYIDKIDWKRGDDPRNVAAIAAYVARALILGRENLREVLYNQLERTVFYRLRQVAGEQDWRARSTSEQVLKKLLSTGLPTGGEPVQTHQEAAPAGGRPLQVES